MIPSTIYVISTMESVAGQQRTNKVHMLSSRYWKCVVDAWWEGYHCREISLLYNISSDGVWCIMMKINKENMIWLKEANIIGFMQLLAPCKCHLYYESLLGTRNDHMYPQQQIAVCNMFGGWSFQSHHCNWQHDIRNMRGFCSIQHSHSQKVKLLKCD